MKSIVKIMLFTLSSLSLSLSLSLPLSLLKYRTLSACPYLFRRLRLSSLLRSGDLLFLLFSFLIGLAVDLIWRRRRRSSSFALILQPLLELLELCLVPRLQILFESLGFVLLRPGSPRLELGVVVEDGLGAEGFRNLFAYYLLVRIH